MIPAARLRERVQLKTPVQVPAAEGGFEKRYVRLLTLWAEVKPRTLNFSNVAYVRGVQTNELEGRDSITHLITVRRGSLDNPVGAAFGLSFSSQFNTNIEGLGREFSLDFSTDFDMVVDLNPAKSELFMFLERGNTTKGRLFRIMGTQDVKEQREFLQFFCVEEHEEGTGYQN